MIGSSGFPKKDQWQFDGDVLAFAVPEASVDWLKPINEMGCCGGSRQDGAGGWAEPEEGRGQGASSAPSTRAPRAWRSDRATRTPGPAASAASQALGDPARRPRLRSLADLHRRRDL